MPIIFPRPFAFSVDDLGWNDGSDMSILPGGGPHRAGVKRTFELNDYRYIIEVGKAVGARVQCLFILSEMDRENVLAKYPTTTYLRDKWDNRHRVNERQREIMNYVRDQSAYMEFGLHGTGHEYWSGGDRQKRAEWYNLVDRKPWPEDELRGHIEAFTKIMAQYGFTKENGHSFPESFVPCAYSYYWNPKGDYSLGKLLHEAGVKYANTDFSQVPELDPPEGDNGGSFDHGVHVINRINYGNVWHEIDKLPVTPVAEQGSDVIEAHWPNWLAQDDFLQAETTARWIEYYRSIQRMADRFIARNTEQLHSQWLYKKYSVVKETKPGVVTIDNTAMPVESYQRPLLGNLVLKVKVDEGQHVSLAKLDGKDVMAYYEDEGFGFLLLPPLSQKVYTLEYSLSGEHMRFCVWNDGTYNVYEVERLENGIRARVRVYGEQVIKIKSPSLKKANVDGDLILVSSTYEAGSGEAQVRVRSKDMQGSGGKVTVTW